jgi:diadenosine tetraphosphate (Ap4A) HIT family hydrolase
MPPCVTCELVKRRDDGDAPLWDRIRRTANWDVVHAFGTAIEGHLVLVVRRHITSVADMTADEAAELGPLIREASRSVQAVIGCDKTYVAQFAEHPDHPHVHVHVIPRARDLAPEHRGPRVFSLLGVSDDAAVPEAQMTQLAQRLDAELAL